MTSKSLETLIRRHFDEELKEAPQGHRERSERCPPLWRFVEASRGGWKPAEQAHVSGCGYCQKTLAQQWRYRHPSLWELALYGLGRSANEVAMKRHLEQDRCPRCRGLLESRPLSRALELARTGERELERLEGWLRGVAISSGELAYSGNFAETEQARFEIRGESPDGSLRATLRQSVANVLEAEIESPDAQQAGRRVGVEVLRRDAEPLVAQPVLDSDADGCFAVHEFGPIGDYARSLDNCTLAVYWFTG